MSTYQELKDLVVSGALEPGERTSEAELAAQLGVSRTPVREALQRLEGDGLVFAQGRGVRIRVMAAAEMADVLTARAGLEGWAVRLAAERVAAGRVTPASLAELDRLADDADALTRAGDLAGGADANRDFHRGVAALSESPVIMLALDQWWDRVTVSTRHTIRTPDRVAEVDREHRTILTALRAGLPDKARSAAEAHILTTRNALLELEPEESHA
ncbi:GntR family transcriptional regulator [Leucobacter sp. M11]|uniref:GntR family transcriptional regulator n=1 Tax=Leucobacter sp. M11 TaxID=2993565 RepID=UPI002D7FD2EC|nr:GntR family transcriptional regulator [Leucobacter sp. M11]MEB4614449.1 GntR family transcriptional regulator [Leucobacter sp. M11]